MNTRLLAFQGDAVVDLLRNAGIPLEVVRFLGRLHPLLVHFPIALLLMATLLELLRRQGRERPARGAYACLAVAAFVGLAGGASGWINAALEPHSRSLATTLTNHRWLGVGTVVLALVSFGFATLQRFGWQAAAVPYRGTLLLATMLVFPTGHLGATLVYGPGYFGEVFAQPVVSEPTEAGAPESPEPPEPVDGAPVALDTTEDPGDVPPPGAGSADPASEGLALYHDVIRPLFEARCVECHGPDERKGGLRLDLLAEALDPEDGVILAGDAAGSYLYELVRLDPEDPDLMPAEGEPLSAAEQEAIRRWIDAGAPHDSAGEEDRASEPPPAPGDGGAEALEEARENASSAPASSGAAEVAEALEAVGRAGGSGQRVGLDTEDVEVSFSRRAEADDATLETLAGLEAVLVSLRLDGTGVTDAGVEALARRFPRLTRLDLSSTRIGDAAIESLGRLPRLASLNLYGTSVTDAGVAALAGLPTLERVYLWGSAATADGVAALRAARPGLTVEFGELAAAVTPPATPPAEPALTPAPCCAQAAAEGSACAHPCCVAAREDGAPVCTKCGGVAGN